MLGDEKSINIAVIPVSENGCGSDAGSVAVSYPEVMVKYTLNPNYQPPSPHTTDRYYVSSDQKTWPAARQTCQAMGRDLVIVDSELKQYYLQQILDPQISYWIGYTDEVQEGTWKWVDGTTGWIGGPAGTAQTYNNWKSGEPNNAGSGEDYGHILADTGFHWNDASQTYLANYICEPPRTTSCKTDSEYCTSNADCCTGLCDAMNGCVSCLAAGNNCSGSAECCSKNCSGGKCLSCQAPGSTCTDNSNCCSGSCSGGTCACIAKGSTCLNGTDCCTEKCSVNQCVCRSAGETCKSNDQCCQKCSGGVCALKDDGESCSVDADCLHSHCCSGTCRNFQTDKNNCNGCGLVCQDNHTTSNNCVSGACSPVCSPGYANCDTNNYNGCEKDIISYPVGTGSICSNPVNKGSADGNLHCCTAWPWSCGTTSSWVDWFTETGVGGKWFRARVTQNTGCTTWNEHRINFTVPAGVTYKINIYRYDCLTQYSTQTASGSSITLFVDNYNAAFDYFVNIEYVSGQSCSNWTLDIDWADCSCV